MDSDAAKAAACLATAPCAQQPQPLEQQLDDAVALERAQGDQLTGGSDHNPCGWAVDDFTDSHKGPLRVAW